MEIVARDYPRVGRYGNGLRRGVVGVSVFVESRGSGFPVVLLHGAPTTVEHMRPLAERLSAHYRTLLVHLPGYGRSAALDPYDLDVAHEAVERAADENGVKSCAFVGLSGGSYRSFAIATRRRIDVRAIVAIGGIAYFPSEIAERLRSYRGPLEAGVDTDPIIEAAMITTARARADAECVADVRNWARAISRANLANELDALAGAPDLRSAIAELDVPILLRVGDADPATPPALSREIASVARHATLEVVSDVGHTILREDFEATAVSIERFSRAVL